MAVVPGTSATNRPTAKTAAAKAPAPAPSPVTPDGNKNLALLVKSLETIQISSVGELNEFLEALRALSRMLAVYTALAAGEAKANMTAAAKSNARLSTPGFNARMSIRRVTKHIDAAANSLADTAALAVSAWTTFEKEFDAVLQNSAHTPRAKRKFDFNS